MLGIFIIILLLLIGLNITTSMKNTSPLAGPAFPPMSKQENFLSARDAANDYRLLADVIPVTNPEDTVRYDITSDVCRQMDASEDLKLNGDYSQRTNNYKRTFPDSCSAPRHEMLLDFYSSDKQKPFQDGNMAC